MNSLVIPAYNEEKRIEKTINSLLNLAGFELVFVVDGDDGTAGIVSKYASEHDNIRLLKPEVRHGKWAAIILGVRRSRGEFVGFVDADLPITLTDIRNGFKLAHSSDIVIGSRTAPLAKTHRSLGRAITSRLFNWYVKLLFHLPFSDTQCGFKVFKKEVILDLAPRIETRGWITDVELLHKALSFGYSVVELPVTWVEQPGSKLSLKSMIGMLFSLLKLRLGHD